MLNKHFETTGELPHALANRPSAPAELRWVMQAFNALSRYRTWREGIPDPIGFSEAVTYAKLYQVNHPEAVFEFCELINSCDAAYIGHFLKESKRKMDALKNKNKSKK